MTKSHEHIHLLGDPQENFYILGKKDKYSYAQMYQQSSMLCARSPNMAKIIKITTELSRQLLVKRQPHNINELKAYAEGLERSLNDVLFALLLPEIVASFNKWVPPLISIIPGCSSLFTHNSSTQEIVHTRILDYALSGPFEKYERSVFYDFNDRYKTFAYSTTGMPFPALSAMNEKGLSLALHYKHGKFFDLEGNSIFLIANQIMNQCSNIREAIKLVKKTKSISYWGLYLCDQNAEVASIDIQGNEVFQEKFDLTDHNYLYFNNRPLLKQNELESIQPYGNIHQCQMRRTEVKNQFHGFHSQTSDDLMMDTIKILGKQKKSKNKTAKNWNLSALTPSSIQLCSFELSKKSSLFVCGNTPKYFEGHYVHFAKIFQDFQMHEHTKKTKRKSNYIIGQRKLATYQSLLDLGNITEAYHEIQMAIEYLSNYSEVYIAKFFFLITQYIYETDKRELTYLHQQLDALKDKLPSYLEDHRILFLMRLERLIGQKVNSQIDKIQHDKLKQLYRHEIKLNAIALKALRSLIFPRIEIVDIIYAYSD
jgi:predicted choloylglycine hydrolase